MKRFLTSIAAAVVLTSAFAATTFAGWGPNGMYGNADPNARPVGQSSTPSTHPASAPITTPFNPNADLGAVPGSYKDPAVRAKYSQEWLKYREAKAKAAVEGKPFDKKNNSPRLMPQTFSGNMSQNSGFFGNNVMNRGVPQMPKPSRINGMPPRPHFR